MTGSAGIAIGNRWEKCALEHLRSNGLQRVTENFRCRLGEIDLIMIDRNCLVFVEVRYRRAGRFASAAASVGRRKQHKIIRAASLYLAKNPQYSEMPARFDVVAIDAAPADQCTLQWLKDAFRAET